MLLPPGGELWNYLIMTISDQSKFPKLLSFLILFIEFSSHNMMELRLHFLYIIPADSHDLSKHTETWNMAGTFKSWLKTRLLFDSLEWLCYVSIFNSASTCYR